MRTVEGHPDFGQLEARLLDLVEAIKKDDPLAPLLIVVATTRLRQHLQRLLARRFGALLNVSILHHARLASEAAAAGGARLPRLMPPRVREGILGRCLEEGPAGLADYVHGCPGALSVLRNTMDDLRDAGAGADACRGLKLSPRGRETVDLFGRYGAALQALERRELADEAGRACQAARHAAAFAGRFRAVIHYGAYELIGSNLQLVQALEEAGIPVTWLIPHHPSAPAYAFARRFVESSLKAEVTTLPDGDSPARLLAGRLTFLYDEEAAPPPARPGGVEFFHCQGAAAELQETARRVLHRVRREEVPLSEMALVARDLSPYAPLLEPVLLKEHGLPFSASASVPAAANPHALAAVRLARLLVDDWERQPLLDLVRTGLLRDGGAITVEDASAWDLLSRRRGVSRGRRAWLALAHAAGSDLPEIREEAPQEGAPVQEEQAAGGRRTGLTAAVRKLKRLVEGLEKIARRMEEARSWEEWAAPLEEALEKRLRGFRPASGGEDGRPAAGVETVRNVLAELRLLDPAGVPFKGGEALARFERSIAEESIPLGNQGGEPTLPDNGGLRVLNAEQARGLSFRHLFLIGFNADLIPRRPREDPFLPDGDRARIRSALDLPVPVKGAAREEEHLLLAHLLGSARESLTISWQRSDDSGRARVPSLALREVARVVLGDADPGLPLQPGRAHRVAAHPADLAKECLDRFGLMPPGAARLGPALAAGSPAILSGALDRLPQPPGPGLAENLAAGLALLEAVESFEAGPLPYDGMVGGAAPIRESWTVSQLETLGNCALHYFFRHVLQVEVEDNVLEEHQLESSEMGLLVHAVLHDTYRRLMDEGILSGPKSDPGRAARRGLAIMEEIWVVRAKEIAVRMNRRYPFLWRQLSELWKNSLRTFLLHDIADLERQGARVVGVEHEVTAELIVEHTRPPLSLKGRFDRLVRGEDGRPVVSDYKTGGKLANLVDSARILKGRALQLPLYILMEEDEARRQERDDTGISAEAIGIGPSFSEAASAESSRPEGYPSREILDAGKFRSIRGSLMETLRVLAETAEKGAFPLNPATTWCSWCPYARACRKGQAPTLARLEAHPAAARYMDLDGKSTRKPFLDDEPGKGKGVS